MLTSQDFHAIDRHLEQEYARIQDTHRICHIEMHPRAYLTLCHAIRSADPVAPHPTKWQGIEIKVTELTDFPCRIITSHEHPQ